MSTLGRVRPSSGFTLIEVLAVLFLTALVLSAALGFYVDLSNESARASETTREVRRATTLMDRIARDIERTVLVKKQPDEDPLAHPWIFLAESQFDVDGADRLKFMLRGEPPSTNQGQASDLETVAYSLEPSEQPGSYELRRWSSPHLPERLDRDFPSPEDPASLVLADGISYFALRFLDEAGEWVDAWDSSQMTESSELPVAVEIELALTPPPGEQPESAEAEPLHYSRRVLLPMRPIDLAALLDPNQVAANGSDQNCEYTVADCIDWSKVGGGGARTGGAPSASNLGELAAGAASAADFAALGEFIASAPTTCWDDNLRALYGSHPAVRDFCR
jgi:type II secretion system protein J